MATIELITILVMREEKFEIPREFTDYRDYMGLSSIV